MTNHKRLGPGLWVLPKLLTLLVVMALVAVACGDSDDEATRSRADDGASEAPSTDDGASEAPSTDDGEAASDDAVSASGDGDDDGGILIWVDAPRVPAAEAFQEAFPDIPIEINTIGGTVGGTDLQQQFALFNQAGEGWPDAIFFPSNDDIAWAAGPVDYALDLTDLVSADVRAGYDPAAIAPCVIDGRWRCLRNDVAPDVLWYNAVFFEDNGYDVPTTWAEYEELGLAIADEHPGSFTGMLGDAYAPNRYLWASGCSTNESLGGQTVRIALDDSNCTRVIEMLDNLLAAGVVSPVGVFDSAAATDVGPNLVMSPGATWYGNYLFRDTWGAPENTIAAAPPLKWEGEEGFTGNEGGGFWGASRHIEGKKLANTLTFMEFVCCDERWQVALSTGLPAFGPNQQPWLDNAVAAGYFRDVEGLDDVFADAAVRVRPGFSYQLYNTGGIWSQTITPALANGESMSGAWGSFSDRLIQEAESFGLEVVTE